MILELEMLTKGITPSFRHMAVYKIDCFSASERVSRYTRRQVVWNLRTPTT